jgi:hypothetical protein
VDKDMMNRLFHYKIILLSFASIVVLALSGSVGEFKYEPFVIVLGNFIIAFFITKTLTSNQKKEEISLDHALSDVSELLELLQEIKRDIKEYSELLIIENKNVLYYSLVPQKTSKSTLETQMAEIISKLSIFTQLVSMLSYHTLVNQNDTRILAELQKRLENDVTQTTSINKDWFSTQLKLHRALLATRKNVSINFRK